MNRIAFSIIFGFSLLTTAIAMNGIMGTTKTIALLFALVSFVLTITSFVFLLIACLKKD